MSLIHPDAYIHAGVTIGENVTIGPGCRIGLPPEIKDGYQEREMGRVIILDGAVLTGGVCVDSGSSGFTVIGEGCFLMSGVHVGHDCKIGDRTVIAAGATLAGYVTTGEDAFIGINAAIHQRAHIPEKTIIGAGGVVLDSQPLSEKSAYAGNPVRYLGPNKRWTE
jgi:UDP-N-acetylglucosamine acyltransferase